MGRRMPSFTKADFERWRKEPTRFISEILCNPETPGEPFDLLPAEVAFFDHAWRTDSDGRLLFPEQLYACPKKSGKTLFGALHMLVTTLIFGGQFAEAYAVANDFEQAASRVFQAARRIVECSPLLRNEARVLSDRIEFTNGAVIQAIASDYASASGANPNISVFDELWGYRSERSHRLFDEMIPPPTRKIACRLTVTYAGFEGESLLLEELYKRGLAQPSIGTDLYAGDGLLCFWSHSVIAPWQTDQWLAQMRRQLRPNQFLRMIENRFVSNETSFVEMAEWDRCVDPEAAPIMENKALPVWIAVDASTKHDASVVLACAYDHDERKARLINHRIFQPSPDAPLNFENTLEATIKEFCGRYQVQAVLYDPWQMAAVAQRLRVWGAPMVEAPQTVPYLSEIGSNLYALIRSNTLITYPDADLRLAISRAVSKETERGVIISKAKASHKIDLVVALAMAAKAVVVRGPYTVPLLTFEGFGVYTQPYNFPGEVRAGAAEDAAAAAAVGQGTHDRYGNVIRHRSAGNNGSLVW